MRRKHAGLLVLAACWQLAASAADALPLSLEGRWHTSEAVGVGDIRQTDMLLATDGFGIISGASPLMARMQGMDRRRLKLSTIPSGMPVRLTLDASTRHVRIDPHVLNGIDAAGRSTFRCNVDSLATTLTCLLNDGSVTVWRRRSETMPDKDAATITMLRRHFP